MRYRHLLYILSAFALTSVTSCVHESLDDPSRSLYQGDGTVVDVNLSYGSSESNKITKALSDDSERQVNDILVLAFPVSGIDATGNPVFDPNKPVFKQYFSKSEIDEAYSQPYHYNAGVVSIHNIPKGTYIFEGVANILSSEYVNQDLYDQLNGVISWQDYCEVKATLTKKSNIERIVPSLLMSGTYRELDYNDDHHSRIPVSITSAGDLSGYIHLVRVDARVKFLIKNNIERVKSFNLTSWRVYNIPDDVNINSLSSSTPSSVSNSNSFSSFTSRDTEHSFEFYIPEYVFTSTDANLDMIRKREKRNEADTQWLYAPQDAPYVVFTGKMEMLVDDAETGETDVNRYADVKFTVHLGACDGASEAEKSKDFKTDRNTKYTYNIIINGVNDIVVEAKKESVEYNHGVEGVVIDNVGGVTFNFDSHYGIANIPLSKNDLKKMSVTLSSVVGEQNFNRDNAGNVISNNLDVHSEDFQAFRFSFEPVSSELAYKSATPQIFRERFVSYSETYDAGKYLEVLHNEVAQPKDDSHTHAMYDLLSMLEGLPFGDGEAQYKDQSLIDFLDAAEVSSDNKYASRDDIPVVFTVFVNENVYYKDVEDWHKHANTKDRLLRMFTSSALSEDGKSEYIRGKYIFDQKYCQTYYSDLNNEALCVEFVNEHHHKDIKNTKGANVGAGASVKSGWSYVNAELNGKEWNVCSDQTIPLCNHYNAFQTLFAENGVSAKRIPDCNDTNDYEAVYASLSRNRDLNRDGVIDSKELKWFLASMEQYIQITIGGAALAKKIFTPDDYYNWNESIDGPRGDIFGNVRFHFCGVERKSKFWAEEGYTVGNQSVEGAAESSSGWRSNPWELLCCRMLVDHSRVDEEEIHWNDFEDLYYYSNRSKNVVAMDKYNRSLHRQEVVGWIDLHENSDDVANSTFTHFQYAEKDSDLIDKNAGELVLIDRMHKNTYCSNYYEEADASDRGTWRIPNQRETAVMRYLAGLNINTQPNAGAYYLSSSIWPFPSSGQRDYKGYHEVTDFLTIGVNPTKSSPSGQLGSEFMRVRCVRDTDREGNFVGAPEYGNPLNFVAGEFGCEYDGDYADFTVNATMDASLVSSVNVTIDGIPAKTTGISPATSTVDDAVVTASQVSVVWTIETNYGKTLTYRKSYNLPARYWMISRYGVANRYAAVNPDNNRTYVGAADTRDVNSMEAIYKWILTKSNGTPVNESELNTSDTYYLYNAGVEAYISDVATSRSYMGAGGNAVPVRLLNRAGYDGYYVLRLNNNTHANSNGGVDCFGTWNGGPDDGCTYKLTPAVLRGELPFRFTPGEFSTEYDTEDGTRATFTFDASFESATSELVSVSINGVAVQDPAVTGDDIHCEVGNSLIPENGLAEVRWTFTKHGETIVKSQTYELPVKFYLIKSILSSNSWGYPYVYVDAEGNTRANPYPDDVDKSRIPMKYRWVLSGDTASPTGNIPASQVVVNANRSLYLYNLEAQGYIAKPDPVNNNADYLPTGPVPHRFCFDASKNGGFRPYFKWDGTNTYGSCANASRNHVKEKFGFSPAGVDGAYWIFVPVYLDHGAAHE